MIATYENRFREIQEKMTEHIRRDFRLTSKYMDAVDAYYHAAIESTDSLHVIYKDYPIRKTAPFSGWCTATNAPRLKPDTKRLDQMYRNATSFDATPLIMADFKQVDALTENYNYFFFLVCYNIFSSVKSIDLDYIVKEPDTENSFQIGFTNFTAYLCTFTGDEKSTKVIYQPIEYDQTCSRIGL